MCSLGHQDHQDDIRPPKRRRRGLVRLDAPEADAPLLSYAERKARKTAELRAGLAQEEAAGMQPDGAVLDHALGDPEFADCEPLPPHQQDYSDLPENGPRRWWVDN